MDFSTYTFLSIVNSNKLTIDNETANMFLELLKNHGEVMIRSASGETWGIHLGDYGGVNDTGIFFTSGDNVKRILLWEQIEQFWAHRAHTE